jgi:hypothetical protein
MENPISIPTEITPHHVYSSRVLSMHSEFVIDSLCRVNLEENEIWYMSKHHWWPGPSTNLGWNWNLHCQLKEALSITKRLVFNCWFKTVVKGSIWANNIREDLTSPNVRCRGSNGLALSVCVEKLTYTTCFDSDDSVLKFE